MAIEAQMCQDNLGLPMSSQDYFFMENNNNNYYYVYNQQYKLQQQQLLQVQQLHQQQQFQQQYTVNLQDMKRRNSCVNDDGFMFSEPSKKQKLASTTTNTTATTTASTTTTSECDNQMNLSKSLFGQLEKQRQEIDRYITLQNDWLKMALQEQRKQQLGSIIKQFEAKALQILKQKDDEIAEATRKTMELQEMMTKMEVENQAWQRIASENETTVFSLHNTLEQLKQQQKQQGCSTTSSNDIDDVESCCNVYDNNNQMMMMGCCKKCKSRDACVLLLPCRHLCCCKVCDAVVDACPLCKSPKMASIHALIS